MLIKGFEINPIARFWGSSKRGELTNIKRSEINRILGFTGNSTELGKVNGKPTKSWTFTLKEPDGTVHKCYIWDYYATGQWYSVYMPKHIAEALFGERYTAIS